MKSLKSLIFTILSPLAITAANYNYVIIAEIDGHEGEFVHLMDIGTGDRIASTFVTDGKILFEGSAENNPGVQLYIDRSKFAYFVLESDTTVLNLKNHKFEKGGPLSQQREFVKNSVDDLIPMYQQLNDSLKNIYTDKSKLQAAADSIYKTRVNHVKKQLISNLRENSENGIGLLALHLYIGFANEEEWLEIYPTLSEYQKNLEITKRKQRNIEATKNTANGKPFIDFSGKTINGSPAKFSDFIGKGKYVLVDFWASWCGPCRRMGKEVLLPLYEKYKKDDRFMILGVAINDPIKNTVKAIENDGYKWTQLYDVSMKPFGIYGFNGVPRLMLFAPDGTIIERELLGTEADARIQQILESGK